MSWQFIDFPTAPGYQQLFDYIGSPDGVQPIYIGWAPVGVATSTASWKIRKFTYIANTTGGFNISKIQLGGPDPGFRQVWDNRTTLTYG